MAQNLISEKRYDEIKREVLFLYEECEVHTYPIDCFAIAKKLHYVIRPYSTLSIERQFIAYNFDPDGFSRVELNRATGMYEYVIYYNDFNANPGRQRWTIFHEIGHIYLDHHSNLDNSLSDVEEAEADFFAKYIIANPPLINISNCCSPEEVETTFKTSHSAAIYLFNYFQKWLYFGPDRYLPFEKKIIELFQAA